MKLASRWAVSLVVASFALVGTACSAQSTSSGSDPAGSASDPAAPVASTAPATSRTTPTNFVRIVQKYGPAVVNVTAHYNHASEMPSDHPGQRRQPPPQQMSQVPEIFRFFGTPFGPQPQQPEGGPAESIGSGFIISRDGYILTNRHVVAHANSVKVTLPDHRTFPAKIVGADRIYDIAVLKIDAHNLPTVQIGNSNDLQAGEWVLAIGSPMGLTHSVSAGIISYVGRTLGRDQPTVPFIQTDVPINRGNSGGPLFDLAGQVVGINSQIFSTSGGAMGLSFAIPINIAMDAAHQLETKGYVSRGMIGVSIQNVTPQIAKAYDFGTATGAVIAQVEPGGAAAAAGLKPGDLITSFDGTRIYSSAQLPPVVAMTRPGADVNVAILRDGKPMTIRVKVAPMPRNGVTRELIAAGRGGATGSSSRLGLTVQNLTPRLRQQLGYRGQGGVAITGARGVAAMAGLQPGDVILQVDRHPVDSVTDFRRELRTVRPGDTVLLLVSRQGQNMFVAITVAAG